MAEGEPYDDEKDMGPGDADYDLSEAHGYLWEPAHRTWPSRWLLIGVTVLIIAALVLPGVIVILARR